MAEDRWYCPQCKKYPDKIAFYHYEPDITVEKWDGKEYEFDHSTSFRSKHIVYCDQCNTELGIRGKMRSAKEIRERIKQCSEGRKECLKANFKDIKIVSGGYFVPDDCYDDLLVSEQYSASIESLKWVLEED